MTRIVKIKKTGGPEVLKFETTKLNSPTPEEVLIEHKAIGLNFKTSGPPVFSILTTRVIF